MQRSDAIARTREINKENKTTQKSEKKQEKRGKSEKENENIRIRKENTN